MVKVKICGIQTKPAAAAIVRAGADALGFHVGEVAKSKNIIPPEKAADIIKTLPEYVLPVLVTTSMDVAAILETVQFIGARAVQIRSAVHTKDLQRLKREMPELKIFKTVHVTDEMAIEDARLYASVSDYILLDSPPRLPGQLGGTGATHDLSISGKIARSVSQPVILAGGLTPTNVALAIAAVKPDMVDVNSGVSNKDGTKDLDKVKAFIKAAKKA